MSSPSSAPTDSTPASPSPPPSSSTPPPTTNSSSSSPPPTDQTPAAPPPAVASPPSPSVSTPSPPAPPPKSTTPSPPPVQQSSRPPAESPPALPSLPHHRRPPFSSRRRRRLNHRPPLSSSRRRRHHRRRLNHRPPPVQQSPSKSLPDYASPPSSSSFPFPTSSISLPPSSSSSSYPFPTSSISLTHSSFSLPFPISLPPSSFSFPFYISSLSPASSPSSSVFFPPPGTIPALSAPPPSSLTPPPTRSSSPSISLPPSSSSFTPSPPSTLAPSTPPTISPSPTSSSAGIIAGVVVAAIVAVAILALVLYYCKKKKKRHSGDHHGPHQAEDHVATPQGSSEAAQGLRNPISSFSYAELAAATNGFSEANMLGEGGFGYVHKGVLSNGQVVAVKQLKIGASQGEREFQAEVEIISRVHHRNLVSLVGYCIKDSQRLLVYDYVANNTLEYHIHKKKEGPPLDWPTRLKIARGAARGLAYLHEDCHPRIIHRDIKSANILLDNNFEAQVSDFGLAKLTLDTNTHVSTRIMGTFGYLAPEYASSGKLTEKSDVFSFGVVLLELLTGRKPVDGSQSLAEWARPILVQIESEEDLEIVVDPSLNGAYDSKEVMRMVEAAAACVCPSGPERPRMGQVVRALENEMSLRDLNKGLKPSQSNVHGLSISRSEYEEGSHNADIRRIRQ